MRWSQRYVVIMLVLTMRIGRLSESEYQVNTFEDLVNLTDREIQRILREVDSKDLAVALIGGSDDLKDRIFSNVSERVGAMILEEMESSGSVGRRDVKTRDWES